MKKSFNDNLDKESSSASNEPADHSDIDHPPVPAEPSGLPTEVGGRGGLEPTRYGDWEKNGRCIDF
jgi:hypothetical protein